MRAWEFTSDNRYYVNFTGRSASTYALPRPGAGSGTRFTTGYGAFHYEDKLRGKGAAAPLGSN